MLNIKKKISEENFEKPIVQASILFQNPFLGVDFRGTL